MGSFLSRLGILFGTRIDDQPSTSIPLHHKCRNCGRSCDPSSSENNCNHAKFTRTGTRDQPAVTRSIVPNEKVRWSTAFKYHPVEFTSEKVRTSTKEYIDRDPREQAHVEIPWNTNDSLCDRRSYHGKYDIVGQVPQNPCGRTGVTGRGHLGRFSRARSYRIRWKERFVKVTSVRTMLLIRSSLDGNAMRMERKCFTRKLTNQSCNSCASVDEIPVNTLFQAAWSIGKSASLRHYNENLSKKLWIFPNRVRRGRRI